MPRSVQNAILSIIITSHGPFEYSRHSEDFLRLEILEWKGIKGRNQKFHMDRLHGAAFHSFQVETSRIVCLRSSEFVGSVYYFKKLQIAVYIKTKKCSTNVSKPPPIAAKGMSAPLCI